MKRMTKLDKYGHPYTNEKINFRNLVSKDGINYQFVELENGVNAYDGEPIDKLYTIEEFEEELKLPLEIIFKAMKNGVWVKHIDLISKEPIYYENIQLEFYKKFWILWISKETDIDHPFVRELIDYGYTWALTKEELE